MVHEELTVNLGNDRGSITIIDFPGLGVSISDDGNNIPLYHEILPSCDVALWIIKADTRAFAEDQRNIRDILSPELKDRLVIGINQLDLIQPGEWIDEFNLPTREQKETIEAKIANVKEIFSAVCAIRPEQIIPYSARKSYQVTNLLEAMMQACPDERAWILNSRAKVAPYTPAKLQKEWNNGAHQSRKRLLRK